MARVYRSSVHRRLQLGGIVSQSMRVCAMSGNFATGKFGDNAMRVRAPSREWHAIPSVDVAIRHQIPILA